MVGCFKSPTEVEKNFRVIPEPKNEIFPLQKGNYWIYKTSINGSNGTNFRHDTIRIEDSILYNKEYYYKVYDSESKLNIYCKSDETGLSCGGDTYIVDMYYPFPSENGYVFDQGNLNLNENETYIVKRKLTSINEKKKFKENYYDCYQFTDMLYKLDGVLFYNQYKVSYFAPKLGLIEENGYKVENGELKIFESKELIETNVKP